MMHLVRTAKPAVSNQVPHTDKNWRPIATSAQWLMWNALPFAPSSETLPGLNVLWHSHPLPRALCGRKKSTRE